MINLIVAIAENNAIGIAGDLLCHLPNDLKHFKEITTGATVVMGKNTFFSLPRRPYLIAETSCSQRIQSLHTKTPK